MPIYSGGMRNWRGKIYGKRGTLKQYYRNVTSVWNGNPQEYWQDSRKFL